MTPASQRQSCTVIVVSYLIVIPTWVPSNFTWYVWKLLITIVLFSVFLFGGAQWSFFFFCTIGVWVQLRLYNIRLYWYSAFTTALNIDNNIIVKTIPTCALLLEAPRSCQAPIKISSVTHMLPRRCNHETQTFLLRRMTRSNCWDQSAVGSHKGQQTPYDKNNNNSNKNSWALENCCQRQGHLVETNKPKKV